MIENLLRNLIPIMMNRVADIPVNEKKQYAMFLKLLCEAYLSDDRDNFEVLFEQMGLPDNMKGMISGALWDWNPSL